MNLKGRQLKALRECQRRAMQAGYVYCPYIPLVFSEQVVIRAVITEAIIAELRPTDVAATKTSANHER